MGRSPVETWPFGGNRLVSRRLEVSRTGVVGLDLETFSRLHTQQRFVAPVKCVLASKLAGDALHLIAHNSMLLKGVNVTADFQLTMLTGGNSPSRIFSQGRNSFLPHGNWF